MQNHKHLDYFFDRVIQEKALTPSHISLYMALLLCWQHNEFKNPVSITQKDIMLLSKIASKTTYHKCIKLLHSLGLIHYQPSFNPFKGSQITIPKPPP